MRKINSIEDWDKFIDDFDAYANGDSVLWVALPGEDPELGWRITVCRLWIYPNHVAQRDGVGVYEYDDPSDNPDVKTPQEYYDMIADKIGTPFCVHAGLDYDWL